jgi:UTP:GlnB (protein PII) uridylyltransferase
MYRVTIENDTYENATVVKVHSANRHGILLNVVQVLTDLDLSITKSDIFSDGDWFMDGKFSVLPATVFDVYVCSVNQIR